MKSVGDDLFRGLFGSAFHCHEEGPLNRYFNERIVNSRGGNILHKYWALIKTQEQNKVDDMALLLNEVPTQESD